MTDKPDRQDRELELRTRALFGASVSEIDAPTRARLTRARRRAIAAMDAPALKAWPIARFPQTVAAAVLLAAVVFWIMMGSEELSDQDFETMAGASDLELLLDDEELEMFEELDFYAWLEQQPELRTLDGNEAGTG